MWVTGDDSRSESRCRNRKTHDSSSNQPQSFGDFHHGTSRLLSRLETKLTCPSPTTTTGARGPRFHTNRRRGFDIPETSSLAKLNGRSTSCASFPYYYTVYYINTTSQPKGTTSLQSILIDDNGTPATWTLGLVFQQAIDRQDRTTDWGTLQSTGTTGALR